MSGILFRIQFSLCKSRHRLMVCIIPMESQLFVKAEVTVSCRIIMCMLDQDFLEQI